MISFELPQRYVIALDGYSGCGKSTLAKDIAKALNIIFIDTGAMYRAVTLFALRNGMTENQDIRKDMLIPRLQELSIDFRPDANMPNALHLNGENVEAEIRKPEVASLVSHVAAISEVRAFLVNQQRFLGRNGRVVLDGRDIGTVVFTDANIKFFVTAQPEVRAQRRFAEMTSKGIQTTLAEVAAPLAERDRIDTTREDSPLAKADDAIVIDNSYLSVEQQLQMALDFIAKNIQQNG